MVSRDELLSQSAVELRRRIEKLSGAAPAVHAIVTHTARPAVHTPKDIIDKLNRETVKALQTPDVKEQLNSPIDNRRAGQPRLTRPRLNGQPFMLSSGSGRRSMNN